MESRRTQQQRREAAKAKLIAATIGLIGEHGLRGFSVSDVAERSGLDRGLVGHHFKTIGALKQAAAAECFREDEGRAGERGMIPMLAWIEAQLARAAARDLRLLATLQVALGPAAPEVKELRETYWRRENERLQQHLKIATPDLDPAATASVVLAMLHGEQLRIVATGHPPQPELLELLKRALAAGPRRRVARTTPTVKGARRDLFE